MKWHEGWIGGSHTDEAVKGFYGGYSFLSNFYECPVMWKGLTFKSSKAAYQAAKSLDPREWLRFSHMKAGISKKEGRKLVIRPDWEDVKLQMMVDICLDKFIRNDNLRQKLIDTGDKHLEETNWWGDTFWGVCNGVGQNKLGETLMLIRNKLKS